MYTSKEPRQMLQGRSDTHLGTHLKPKCGSRQAYVGIDAFWKPDERLYRILTRKRVRAFGIQD